MRLIVEVDGATAECGAFEGASSWLICAANRAGHKPRVHHIFDSFEGLSTPGREDGSYWETGNLAAPTETVAENLKEFEGGFRLHKGWIPDRFGEVEQERFAFVHIDVDLHEPTLESVRFFYDRLNSGGVLLCDDYAFASCPGATRAIDEFLRDKPEKMIMLDGGGGYFIKGVRTGEAIGLPVTDK